MRENPEGGRRVGARRRPWAAAGALAALFFLLPHGSSAQDNPKFVIDEDCQTFDIAANNAILYAVPHLKRIKRLIVERDDIWIATGPGKARKVVDSDKFMPIPPPNGYVVNKLTWAPDSQHFTADLTLQQPPPGYEAEIAKMEKKKKEESREVDAEDEKSLASIGGDKVVAFFDNDGREIKVAGSKSRFVGNASKATWLADGATIVYATAGPPYTISRVNPADGQTTALFEGHTFDALIWDAPHNRAFAVGANLSLRGQLTLVQLDLLHEGVTEIGKLDSYRGSLSLSPSGKKIGFFEDGDTIEVIDLANPSKRLHARAGIGRFEWGRDERRILIKRGPEDQSNDLVWVGLYDDSFTPALHDLGFHDFHISPDQQWLAVTIPGKRALKVYSLE